MEIFGFFVASSLLCCVFSFLFAKALFVEFEIEWELIEVALILEFVVVVDALRVLFEVTGVDTIVVLAGTLLLDEGCDKGVFKTEELAVDVFGICRLPAARVAALLANLVGMRGFSAIGDDEVAPFFVSILAGTSGFVNSVISLVAWEESTFESRQFGWKKIKLLNKNFSSFLCFHRNSINERKAFLADEKIHPFLLKVFFYKCKHTFQKRFKIKFMHRLEIWNKLFRKENKELTLVFKTQKCIIIWMF